MTYNLLIFIAFYLLILTSLLGYGLFFLKLLNIKTNQINFGYAGLFGIYILLAYSYLSNIVIAHTEIHNSVIHFIGIVLFILSIKRKYFEYKKEIIFTLIVFALIFCALLQFKNHDDFSYYHLPYTYYLTQQSLYIGVGGFNHGFRTPSSIFYLNSLFYLPVAKFYLLNFSSIFILGFANIALLKKIHHYFRFSNTTKKDVNVVNFLSLFSFIFINIFFYRLSEYGTDRAAMILIFLFIIELLRFTYIQKIESSDLFHIYFLGAIIVSLKAFYILYLIFVIPLFICVIKKKIFYIKSFNFLFINRYCVIFLVLLFFVLGTSFINTGCLVYPISFTCFDNLDWNIPLKIVEQMNNWYELWSKGGAAPNFRAENPGEYIKGFNWVNNWMDIYFFNKISDYILGVVTLIIIVLFFFRKEFFNYKLAKIDKHIYLVYLTVFILGVEWFYNHPTLRYGGYHILALLLFIPISIKLSSAQINLKKYSNTVFILISVTILIFISRNINRIYKEVEFYSYQPIKKTFYRIEENSFRIQEAMNELIVKYNNCQESINKCDINIKVDKKYGKIIFLTQ